MACKETHLAIIYFLSYWSFIRDQLLFVCFPPMKEFQRQEKKPIVLRSIVGYRDFFSRFKYKQSTQSKPIGLGKCSFLRWSRAKKMYIHSLMHSMMLGIRGPNFQSHIGLMMVSWSNDRTVGDWMVNFAPNDHSKRSGVVSDSQRQ